MKIIKTYKITKKPHQYYLCILWKTIEITGKEYSAINNVLYRARLL